MNRQTNLQSRIAVTAAAFVATTGVVFAQAQTGNGNFDAAAARAGGVSDSRKASNTRNTATTDLTPILLRAANLRRIAQDRASDSSTPSAARTSYRAAAEAFSRFQTAARSSGVSSGNGRQGEFVSISSAQAEQDIRTLRLAAREAGGTNVSESSAARAQSLAELYAAGTREFFTAQLRVALYGAVPAQGTVVIRGLPVVDPNNPNNNVPGFENQTPPQYLTPGVPVVPGSAVRPFPNYGYGTGYNYGPIVTPNGIQILDYNFLPWGFGY